jgi:hypothetical protein
MGERRKGSREMKGKERKKNRGKEESRGKERKVKGGD